MAETKLRGTMDSKSALKTGARVALSSGEFTAQYEAATVRAGLVDRSDFGRIKMTGKDALDLLNRLSTNNLVNLASGQGASTVLTDNRGRILDLITVINVGSHLLLLTSPQCVAKVIEWIDRYTFLEEVVVEDVTQNLGMLHVVGPKSSQLLRRIAGLDVSRTALFGCIINKIGSVDVMAVQTDAYRIMGFDLITPAPDVSGVRSVLLKNGIEAVGQEVSGVIRIENGVPNYGKELSEKFNPLEAGLIDSISFSKGCYIGQEVIARLNTYKKVQKRLMGVVVDSEDVPPMGTKLMADGKEVGFVTSSVRSVRLGKPVALAYVKQAVCKTGLGVTVAWDDASARGSLSDLPFRPS